MALSSGGQFWLKQTRQMRHEATFKHELLMTWQVLPQKLCNDANKVDFTRNACQTVTMQYLVTVRGQYRQFLSKCGLHTRNSLQALMVCARHHGGWSPWLHSQLRSSTLTGAQRSCSLLGRHCSLAVSLSFLSTNTHMHTCTDMHTRTHTHMRAHACTDQQQSHTNTSVQSPCQTDRQQTDSYAGCLQLCI